MEVPENQQLKEETRQRFEKMKGYLDQFINLVDKAKQDNAGVLPSEYAKAVHTVKEKLDKFKQLQTHP